MSAEPVLVIRNFTKKYGELVAVRDLDLKIRKGEIFGLLGPNGAGKSTTIRTCLGLLHKTAGNIEIFGMDPHQNSSAIRRRIGYIPSDFGLYPGMTVRSYLNHFRALVDIRSPKKMEALAERLDLDLDRKTHELSRGNRQKVGIVQALMGNPDLIIMDEPTTGLDPLMQKEFYRLLRGMREKGLTVFMSSHILAEVEEVCDRVAIIKNGELVVVENISNLQDKMGKVLEVDFREEVDPDIFLLDGVSDLIYENNRLTLTVSANLDRVIKAVSDHCIVNMNLMTFSLEELFLKYYGDDVVDHRDCGDVGGKGTEDGKDFEDGKGGEK